ncbi:MAG: metallophosphoesterase [Piscirickettsiaceae bacterium]|nr:metallophosphoesterase [Piscirickettsiaceae bacterium]
MDFNKFAEVYNNLKDYPKNADVAEKLGIVPRTVQIKANKIRKRYKNGEDVPKLISRALVPMSEDEGKFMEKWGAEECIAELVRISEIDPDKVVSRNFFRVYSQISESTWNRYFGTFEEFKRQAGIKLTRHQHALERSIAKHASIDHYRALNIERADWGSMYIRENDSRFKTVLVVSDLHDVEIDEFFLRVFLDTAKRLQPDLIVFNGDIFDLPEFGKYGVDPREWDVVGRIKFVHERIFRPLREVCPDCQIDFIEGNHEARLLRALTDATPALRAVLSDLHGFTVGKLLGLEEFEINYIAKANLATFTKGEFNKQLQNNYKIYWDTLLFHHFPHARSWGLPGANGHHHQHQVWPMFSPVFGAYEWHQLGCGHKRSASYCEGEKWHNGFGIANIDIQTKGTAWDYISVTDFCVSGGKWYHREEHESILRGH